MAKASSYESNWMPELARLLRETDKELQIVIPMVTENLHGRGKTQQSHTVGVLPERLKLYYKRK